MKGLAIVIDDNPHILRFINRVLSSQFRVLSFPSAEDALPSLAQATFVVSDFQMPGMGGAGLVRHLEGEGILLPLLIISGLDPDSRELSQIRERNISILPKPFSQSELLDAVDSLLSLGA